MGGGPRRTRLNSVGHAPHRPSIARRRFACAGIRRISRSNLLAGSRASTVDGPCRGRGGACGSQPAGTDCSSQCSFALYCSRLKCPRNGSATFHERSAGATKVSSAKQIALNRPDILEIWQRRSDRIHIGGDASLCRLSSSEMPAEMSPQHALLIASPHQFVQNVVPPAGRDGCLLLLRVCAAAFAVHGTVRRRSLRWALPFRLTPQLIRTRHDEPSEFRAVFSGSRCFPILHLGERPLPFGSSFSFARLGCGFNPEGLGGSEK